MTQSPLVVVLGLDAATITLAASVSRIQLVRDHNPDLQANTISAYPLLHQDLINGIAQAGGRLPAPAPQTDAHRSINKQHAQFPEQLILLADDNETNREVMLEQLNLLGYAAEVACDGVEALEMWRTGHYGLLLTDCHMPNMDGFELTSAIRELEPDNTRLTIIAITANAM